MTVTHNLGFPRIGLNRQTKFAMEAYWQNNLSEADLIAIGKDVRLQNWAMQKETGLAMLPVGDFSWYDHMLDMSVMLGVIPERFKEQAATTELTTYFHMARGTSLAGKKIPPCAMTKWFNTNYHYIVPELDKDQHFHLNCQKLLHEIDEAHACGYTVKPALIGPLTYLWLSKTTTSFEKLTLLEPLLAIYKALLAQLGSKGIQWVQIDEPILVLDLPLEWQKAFAVAYDKLNDSRLKLLLTTYFGSLEENHHLACQLPVNGLHIDALIKPEEAVTIANKLAPETILSLGIINGRNVWKNNLLKSLHFLQPLYEALGERLWLGSSCSFLHVPVDLEVETQLSPEIKSWLAFARQKNVELAILAQALEHGAKSVDLVLKEQQNALETQYNSLLIHNSNIQSRMQEIEQLALERPPYTERKIAQQAKFNFPLLPTTTIGSFPQTAATRKLRGDLKTGKIDSEQYQTSIKQTIADIIKKQEELGLDLLVHGEVERNDMVEYFGEQLKGIAMTTNGWVQSYGSRCVKPPIIYGDIERQRSMTVAFSSYAQSLTKKPVKGMLTGPTTILMWSFVREDQPSYQTAQQLALALRDEVQELEQAGIGAIQIDEPAFREGLPLRRKDWQTYLTEAVHCFKLVSSGVKPETQIHTHMCYSAFNDIINAIAAMDADVISIESSRSQMKLLDAFNDFLYPNEIGPGIYDVHSPCIPTAKEIEQLIIKATQFIPAERLWINPDCGLKTRTWEEVIPALSNMVEAAHALRKKSFY